MSNPDVRMSDPMVDLNEKMPEEFQHLQQYLLDNFSEVPEVLDPQIGWLVRNLAYARGLIASQAAVVENLQKQINVLHSMLEVVAEEVFDE